MNQTFSVNIEPDEEGFTGRTCPKCEQYFKVKFGTGLPIQYHICPYCGYRGNTEEFLTKEQVEYAKSVAVKKVVGPIFDNFHKSIKKLETSTRGGPIQIKVRTSGNLFKIEHYQERILETNVTCDNCGLVFSIYGVFSNCPDCGKLNARVIFDKSIEVLKKKLELSEDSKIENSLKEELLKDALTGAISAFDSVGKALINKYPSIFSSQPRNLFQNFIKLNESLKNSFNKEIKDYLSTEDSEFLFKMFQVRHIYEHNLGVIDDDFIRNLPNFSSQKGRKYKLEKNEIESFLEKLSKLMHDIYSEVE